MRDLKRLGFVIFLLFYIFFLYLLILDVYFVRLDLVWTVLTIQRFFSIRVFIFSFELLGCPIIR